TAQPSASQTAGTAPPPPPMDTASVPPPAPPPSAPSPPKENFAERVLGSVFPTPPPRGPQTSVADFGSESVANGGLSAPPAHRDGATADAISARLVGYKLPDNGRLIVSLDNGQEWTESPGEAPVPHLLHDALSYTVEIRRAKGGTSYIMKLSGLN